MPKHLSQESKTIRTASPLRYPGGKSCMYGIASLILRTNKLEKGAYAEPYAGGCGLALSLLFGGHVSDIYLNDLDPSIYAFWRSVLDHTKDLAKLIETTPVTIDEWERQKSIHQEANLSDPVSLGFATFFLNRTNRSGVIKGAGVIGGISQTGPYKIDCRFNHDDLLRRIKRVAKYRSRIHFSNLDAIPFMKKMSKALPPESFFCIDPPYYDKGSKLYTNFYGPEEHKDVADQILSLNHPWIVTYDSSEEIRKLYTSKRQYLFDINYSLQTKRVGRELLIASKGLRIPNALKDNKAAPLPRRAA